MKLFGSGKLKLVRNQVKGNSIVPFNTNIVTGNYYKGTFLGADRNRNFSDFISILMGQLYGEDRIAPFGIGTQIVLFPIKN